MSEPARLVEARGHLGTREIRGLRHEPRVLQWWKAIRRGGIKDDETPWCAAFVGACLESVGLISTRFESAGSYLTWGVPIHPVLGCVVVLRRAGGGWHVGFLVGVDERGNLLLLGGNQGDAVSIAAFSCGLLAVLGYRWPAAVPWPLYAPLPLTSAAASTSEA